MISLYLADADALCDASLYSRAEAAVSEERRAKTARFRFDSDRRLSLGAGVLLRHALSEAGVDPASPIGRGERGKPYLVGRDDVFFSLSHSGKWVICAVCGEEIGCDIEKTGASGLSVARRFFTAAEYENILRCESEARQNELFCRYWVMKESLMKLTGLGMALSPESFFIDIGSGTTEYGGTLYRFWESGGVPGCRMALCTVGGGEVRLFEVGIGEIV